jgi:hypothetical protein
MHAQSGIQTHGPDIRASEDSSCLRLFSYHDRPHYYYAISQFLNTVGPDHMIHHYTVAFIMPSSILHAFHIIQISMKCSGYNIRVYHNVPHFSLQVQRGKSHSPLLISCMFLASLILGLFYSHKETERAPLYLLNHSLICTSNFTYIF